MVDDEKYEVAFEIIACAGDAKSLALMAIEEARNGNFEQAEKNLAEAREQMAKAAAERAEQQNKPPVKWDEIHNDGDSAE